MRKFKIVKEGVFYCAYDENGHYIESSVHYTKRGITRFLTKNFSSDRKEKEYKSFEFEVE